MIRRVSGWIAVVGSFTMAVGALVLSGESLAKGPEPSEMPSLEQIFQEAQAAKAQAEQDLIAASRDPRREVIDAYRDGSKDLAEYSELTAIINDSKTDELQRYRQPAAAAILQRYRQENLDDPAIRRVRNALALEIIDLMKANSSDDVGLAIIQEVLETWWRNKLVGDVRFKATDKWRERQKAWREMRAYVRGGERK